VAPDPCVAHCFRVTNKRRVEAHAAAPGASASVPDHPMTAPLWIRGILSDYFGDSVTDYTGGEVLPLK
jgi:4,5-dihydroxyphthalate decarboxylase